jgi:hypothetical protein
MITDQEAIEALSAAFGRLDDHDFQDTDALGLLGTALLVTNYGVLGQPPQEMITNNWLGLGYKATSGKCKPGDLANAKAGVCIAVFPSTEEGAWQALSYVKGHRSFRDVLRTGDVGKLAWAILASGFLGVQPNFDLWETTKSGLLLSIGRVAAAYGRDGEGLWTDSDWLPPIESSSKEAMTDEVAYKFLKANASPDVLRDPTKMLGLLAWASVAAHYGYIRGQQTYNWGLIGADATLNGCSNGRLLEESGRWCVDVYPTAAAGIHAFLNKVSGVSAVSSGDVGKLATAMFEERAFGFEIEMTKDSWFGMAAMLNKAMQRISGNTDLVNNWILKEAPKVALEDDEKPVGSGSMLPWILGGLAVLGGGYAVYHFGFKKKDGTNNPTQSSPTPTVPVMSTAAGIAPRALVANPVLSEDEDDEDWDDDEDDDEDWDDDEDEFEDDE